MYNTLIIKFIIQWKYLHKLDKYLGGSLSQYPVCEINYKKGDINDIDGVYIWSDEKGYNYLSFEKNNIKQIVSGDCFDVIYPAVDQYIMVISMKDSAKQMNFRSSFLNKQRELWNMLDERGYKRKCKEIEKSLSKYPLEV